jgi:hypothetical protein
MKKIKKNEAAAVEKHTRSCIDEETESEECLGTSRREGGCGL